MNAKYVHTNVIAGDWRSLAEFYIEVFGCVLLLPERDYEGKWLDEITGVEDAKVKGAHLRLPGYGDDGPTLEIFQYNRTPDRVNSTANRLGFTHIAFHVDDVSEAREKVLEHGGGEVGKVTSFEVSGAGHIELVYLTDPEGNIIELQKWN